MNAEFVYGVLTGAGALALAQNLGDYRIDNEFIEYVFDPVKNFFLHLFGKTTISRLELKGKAVVHDTYAQLTNLQKLAASDASKAVAGLDALVEKVKKSL